MSKLNKKQIENELRGKIVKQYTKRIQELEDNIAKLSSQLAEANKRTHTAEQEKLEMKDKLNQYEDWNNRLQEFMNMSDEDRLAYVENLKKTKELNDTIDRFGFYGKMLGTLFM